MLVWGQNFYFQVFSGIPDSTSSLLLHLPSLSRESSTVGISVICPETKYNKHNHTTDTDKVVMIFNWKSNALHYIFEERNRRRVKTRRVPRDSFKDRQSNLRWLLACLPTVNCRSLLLPTMARSLHCLTASLVENLVLILQQQYLSSQGIFDLNWIRPSSPNYSHEDVHTRNSFL